MAEDRTCRDCGALTVSEAPDRLCFSCQIKRSTAERDARETFFFDESDSSTVHDGIEERVAAALDSIAIEGEIGRGGMGIVFKGVQTRLDRPVAVKVLPPRPDQEASFADRFLLEARAMARLTHANIVAIHDFGQTDCGLNYIVMEYVAGKSLADREGDERLSPRRFVEVVAEIADALAFAHAQDVVHRDMKPDNVLLDGNGRAKIADFGIAKLEGEGHVARLTKTHQILGTPLYMAPEQAMAAREVDHRADLYALGVMLHEGLTGRLPERTLVPPSKQAAVDARLDPIVADLLQRNPDDRKLDARELARQCRAVARDWRDGQKRGLLGRMFGI